MKEDTFYIKINFCIFSQKGDAFDSRTQYSFRASIIEELKYLLQAHLSTLFNIAFAVRSNGCNRCAMFFGSITDSILCFDRTSDTLTID